MPFGQMMRTNAAWGFVDQIASSLSNFAVAALVARASSPRVFGAFAAAFAAYAIALGLSRALTSEPLTVRFASADDVTWADACSAAAGTCVVFGSLAGLFVIACSGAAAGEARRFLLITGALLPGLLFQDFWRYAMVTRGRARAAFANDCLWIGLLGAGLVVVWATGVSGGQMRYLAWAMSGTVAGVTASLRVGIKANPGRTWAWITLVRDMGPRYAGAFIASTASTVAAVYWLVLVAGLQAAGTFRAGQLLAAPLVILFTGVNLVGIPELVRLHANDVHGLVPATRKIIFALVAAVACWFLIFRMVPSSMGQHLLGKSWSGAHELILPIALWMGGSACLCGAGIGLRAMGDARATLRTRLLTVPLEAGAVILGGLRADARGACWGLALIQPITVYVWWRSFTRTLNEVRHVDADPVEAPA